MFLRLPAPSFARTAQALTAALTHIPSPSNLMHASALVVTMSFCHVLATLLCRRLLPRWGFLCVSLPTWTTVQHALKPQAA